MPLQDLPVTLTSALLSMAQARTAAQTARLKTRWRLTCSSRRSQVPLALISSVNPRLLIPTPPTELLRRSTSRAACGKQRLASGHALPYEGGHRAQLQTDAEYSCKIPKNAGVRSMRQAPSHSAQALPMQWGVALRRCCQCRSALPPPRCAALPTPNKTMEMSFKFHQTRWQARPCVLLPLPAGRAVPGPRLAGAPALDQALGAPVARPAGRGPPSGRPGTLARPLPPCQPRPRLGGRGTSPPSGEGRGAAPPVPHAPWHSKAALPRATAPPPRSCPPGTNTPPPA